jgi:hypothetical protein
MQPKHFLKAGLLTLFLVVGFVAGWEWYLRSKGFGISYDEGPALFSDKRAKIYKPQNEATVFIGSSRIKFDLDVPTWEKLTGEEVIQLANVGSTPLPVLDDLAADPKFKGKLVIDVTEGLFFSDNPNNSRRPLEDLAGYKKRTPSERAGFVLDHALESQFVFLDKENFSLPAYLDKLPLSNRPGVFSFPIFPTEFGRVNFSRQETMMDRFVTDTNLQKKVTDIWQFLRSLNKTPPVSGAKLDSFLTTIKNDCDKIRARGGQIIFVRTPSSGPYWMGEQMGFPKDKYWDRILSVTNCQGVHFTDYPAIAHFVCPEWSHLKPADAVLFTENFVEILEREKGWHFNKK